MFDIIFNLPFPVFLILIESISESSTKGDLKILDFFSFDSLPNFGKFLEGCIV